MDSSFYRYERPAGLLVTSYVHVVYMIALRFEGYAVSLALSHSADAAKAIHRHDLLHAFDICQEIFRQGALKPARKIPPTARNSHYGPHASLLTLIKNLAKILHLSGSVDISRILIWIVINP